MIQDHQIHPSTKALLAFFDHDHLPEHLQEIVRPFQHLAWATARRSSNAEATVAIRKLLEAKDCAVRAVLYD